MAVGGLLETDQCIKIKGTLYKGDANDIRDSIYEVNGLSNTPETQGILETVFLQVPILGFKNFIMGYQKSTYEYIGTQMDGQNGRKLLYWI